MTFLTGFALGLSLIVAIGPQNALIIKQGIRKQALIPVLAVCIISDILLIFGGTAGIGAIVERVPWFFTVLKWVGVVYMGYFALISFKEALRPAAQEDITLESVDTSAQEKSHSAASAGSGTIAVKLQQARQATWIKPVLTAIAFTWLNPGAYIDVVLMLGSIANTYPNRWVFAAGALVASCVWFPLLGYSATRFSHVLTRPKVWRVVNIIIGIIMLVLMIKLLRF